MDQHKRVLCPSDLGWSNNVAILCDHILGNLCLREELIFFALALSAVAQHMTHAASDVYTFYELARTNWGLKCRWPEWKAMFKEAKTVENVEARNYDLTAAEAMETAELR